MPKIIGMTDKDFGKQSEERTKSFAISIIRLSMALPNFPESKVIKNQLTKSGTSTGANYREANRSRSKADFSNKIKICESETSETIYWLEIIAELECTDKEKLNIIMAEAKEILAIFTSIGKTLKNSG